MVDVASAVTVRDELQTERILNGITATGANTVNVVVLKGTALDCIAVPTNLGITTSSFQPLVSKSLSLGPAAKHTSLGSRASCVCPIVCTRRIEIMIINLYDKSVRIQRVAGFKLLGSKRQQSVDRIPMSAGLCHAIQRRV